MKGIPMIYRTRDNRESFLFSFEELSSTEWRIYILDQPPYGSAPQDLKSTFRQYDSNGKYIDWTYPPSSFDEAKQIACMWAEFTNQQIKCRPQKKYNRRKKYNYENDPEDPFTQEDPPGSLAGNLHDWLAGIRGGRNSSRN